MNVNVPLVFLAVWLDEAGIDVWRDRDGWRWARRVDLMAAAPRVLGAAVRPVGSSAFAGTRECCVAAAVALWGPTGIPAERAVFGAEIELTGELV